MDAFFASVEQRDRPELRDRPVAVGGSSRRGVVAAASYEARPYGVRSAMSSARAKQICPDLVFVKPRFDVYKEDSRTIRAILRRYSDLIEPLSLDEAYLDVTERASNLREAQSLGTRIKMEILDETGLTASAGISFNKFLAKMASDIKKPDGLYVIAPEDAPAFLAGLPIEDFHGVGRATAEKMKELGIYTGADLRARSERELRARFGKTGGFFYRIVRGEDHRSVQPNRMRKSVGAERTFPRDLRTASEMQKRLVEIAARVAERLARIGLTGRTVTLKIKYPDFRITTRSTTLQRDVHLANDLQHLAVRLLNEPVPNGHVRLLGLTVSNLHALTGQQGARQLTLTLE